MNCFFLSASLWFIQHKCTCRCHKMCQARPCLPGAIIRCPHGKDSACECVKRFDTDKNCLITKQHITTVKASSCELKQIKESNDIQKCNLLSQIIQSEENKKDEYIKQYESFYGLLL
ncbi:unnamed protein product [Adineta steineri]|uniref:Uncharacterized protein n=1 Tax=Adineta steineri TaxID=433720 RepID=A0A813XKR6_9BILA|nr:unnamed protein product [Adineta steineri]CAF3840885.1 unnamed protein product [Adineta steineri]